MLDDLTRLQATKVAVHLTLDDWHQAIERRNVNNRHGKDHRIGEVDHSPKLRCSTHDDEEAKDQLKDVRRQGFWNQWRAKLSESLAHLVGCIMRRVVCDASVALRASFV